MKKGTHLATKVKLSCESILTTVFDGKYLSYLVDWTFCQIQGENPYGRTIKIAKIIDLSGSLVNLSGYDTLRKGVQGDAAGNMERNGDWLVSKYHIMKCMTAIKIAVQNEIPLKHYLDLPANVDGIQFEYKLLFAYLLKLYKLDNMVRDANQLPVEFSITLDGADLSRNISIITAGVKINNPCTIYLKTGIPVSQDHSMPVQSRELCYPFKISIARKELHTLDLLKFLPSSNRLKNAALENLQGHLMLAPHRIYATNEKPNQNHFMIKIQNGQAVPWRDPSMTSHSW